MDGEQQGNSVWTGAWRNQQNVRLAKTQMGSQGPKPSPGGKRRLIRLGGCPGWSESSLDVQVILVVLSCSGPLKTQISLGICPVWSELLSPRWAHRSLCPCGLGLSVRAYIHLSEDRVKIFVQGRISRPIYGSKLILCLPSLGLGDILFLPRSSFCLFVRLSVTNRVRSVTWKLFKIS